MASCGDDTGEEAGEWGIDGVEEEMAGMGWEGSEGNRAGENCRQNLYTRYESVCSKFPKRVFF